MASAACSGAPTAAEGRAFVTPQDVKSVGWDVLRHRVITTYEAEAEGIGSVQVIRRIFDAVRVP